MNSTRLLAIAVGFIRGAQLAFAHDTSRYRAYILENSLEAGGAWRWGRCGQRWDAARLAPVAAYATWRIDHDRVGRRGAEGSHGAPQYGHLPTGRRGGRS